MKFEGKTLRVTSTEEGIATLTLDLQDSSVNKFGAQALAELGQVITELGSDASIKALVITSAKEAFVVGADITEFMGWFKLEDDALSDKLAQTHAIFKDLSELPFPTVAAINGLALGGGFELCLACDYRIMADNAKVGLPETQLGIYPGWGGTVRLPRLIGADNACEWICGGQQKRSADALKDGAVDAVVAKDAVLESAYGLVQQLLAGKFDYRARRAALSAPMTFSPIEKMMVFESVRGVVKGKAGKHYPAPMEAIKTIEKGIFQPIGKAIETEIKGFIKLAKSPVARALVGLFLNDQAVKKAAGKYTKTATPVAHAAVLGAGIMGGGIAYQSASKGTPIIMKDIRQPALELGMSEASKLFGKQIERGKLSAEQAMQSMSAITPVLSFGEFDKVDLVVEAVVENPKVKQSVLAEVEQVIDTNAVLTSNTSTISINHLASALQRPENFCGMHFFNPVHRMPLVEVIRGQHTSDATVAKTVAYAQALGKTPIVVNDCPGFLVNRVLFPYFAGFSALLKDGADYQTVDKVMEKFGWPMGPAYLLDVVGIDTAYHADQVMAQGFPDRMGHEGENAIDRFFKLERYGQKSGSGFYQYETDKKGKPKKLNSSEAQEIVQSLQDQPSDLDEQDIIARMMIPLCIETARCLEEGIVGSAAEADMGLIYGIGFPPYLGGALHYMDEMGLAAFCELADRFAHLGKLYQPTDSMREMAANQRRYHTYQ
ncbi:fatty acid oxidation complex subunit alpha FadB [Marinomonas ostreistagni]|uniref:fatty acid oxidation complex subunit alpha FadB n=1 Tax=Marinomonas ostreistagni TaxID=359209 RepID=UPI00194E3AEA|nr:fatty acid oxidation complex subunit alpha FadB [Marinomonas ostreistagni]MBM6551788.1 fatty acid oxidation complex subunit alpha FadB [Marinomonas ostreistagni]